MDFDNNYLILNQLENTFKMYIKNRLHIRENEQTDHQLMKRKLIWFVHIIG